MNLRRFTLIAMAVLSLGLPVVAARLSPAKPIIVADEPIPLCPPTAPNCPLGGPINQPPPPPTQ